MNSVDRLFSSNFMSIMTNTKRLATIFVLTAILITGSLNAIQYAYSSGPDTLTVKYLTPINSDPEVSTFIQIYKKTDDFGNLPLGPEIPINAQNEEFMVFASNYGKDKLNSNTVFRVIERTSGSDDVEIDVVEIHTSCSKPLYMGQIVPGDNGIVTLEVIDGTLLGDSILPDNVDEECTDNKKPKHTATITLKKAITNDNGGLIITADQIQDSFLPKIDGVDVIFGEPTTISTKEPHIISEATDVLGYSFVLIAGDTECPSMLDEEFTVKKNKDITCTIYNDDNFDENAVGGDGIIFRNHSMMFQLNDVTGHDSCDKTTNPALKDPCIEFVSPTDQRIGIVDSALIDDTTIVLYSVVADGKICDDFENGVCNDPEAEEAAPTPDCANRAIVRHNLEENFFLKDTNDDSYPANPTTHLVFVLECTQMFTNVLYNINYVMIDPLAFTP